MSPYKDIADEILKSDIDCYTKYINDFCSNRLLNKKEPRCCHLPPCLNWVINDNYCSNHQDKKYDFKNFQIKIKCYYSIYNE